MASMAQTIATPTAEGENSPAAFHVLRPDGTANIVITCDHASRLVPPALADLGLQPSDLARHIGWDIGAADIAAYLSAHLDAPAVLSGISRLVIDCNRYPEDPSSIPLVSDGTSIPGNSGLSDAERRARFDTWFVPYHEAVETILAPRLRAGSEPVIVSIHSMTDRMRGTFRPWEIALSSGPDRRLTDPVLAALRAVPGLCVGDNEPYDLVPEEDFSTTTHAIRHGLHHVQVEFRQDRVGTRAEAEGYARVFLDALIDGLSAIGRDARGYPHG
jgi:predicted N-formylglutamate amidohydrolase